MEDLEKQNQELQQYVADLQAKILNQSSAQRRPFQGGAEGELDHKTVVVEFQKEFASRVRAGFPVVVW